MSELSEAERTAIEWRCAQLVNRFSQYSDTRRFEDLAALFTPDGSFARPTDPANPIRGREAILALMSARPPKTMRHFMTNTVIEVDSADQARGVSYILLFTGPAPAEGQAGPVKADPAQLIGAYRDRFVRVGDQWFIAERVGSLDLTTA